MKQHQTRVESRASRAGQAKRYAAVTDFERATSYCPRKAAPRGGPLYLPWRILDEARDYFRTSWVPSPGSATLSHQMGEGLAEQLAHRAEAVFARHPFMQRKYQTARGREAILTSMRHWLTGVLARERPALFRDLPESFKVGHPLPQHTPSRRRAPHPGPLPGAERENHRPRFVHGCELLEV